MTNMCFLICCRQISKSKNYYFPFPFLFCTMSQINIYSVMADDLIAAVAEKLEKSKNVQPPKEAVFWKTAHFKEFAPVESNFWYVRAASILRKLYRENIGVNHLKKIYGGRKRGRTHKAHHANGSGKIIRLILQQLEKEGYVKKTDTKGRELTGPGRSLLDKSAAEIART